MGKEGRREVTYGVGGTVTEKVIMTLNTELVSCLQAGWGRKDKTDNQKI